MSERKSNREQVRRVSFPVEGPLHVVIDQDSGEIVLESPVFDEQSQGEGGFILRLAFSAQAASGFIRMLREVERELDITVANSSVSISAH